MAHLIVLNFLYRNPCRADPLSAKKVMSEKFGAFPVVVSLPYLHVDY